MNNDSKISKRSWEAEADIIKLNKLTFQDESIGSTLSYPKKRKMLFPEEQIRYLKQFFPGLNNDISLKHSLNHLDVDGILVIPNIFKIGLNYYKAIEIVLSFLIKNRPSFLNCKEGELDKKHLKLVNRTNVVFEKLKSQNTNFLAFPIQLGRRHLGKSARQAHMDLMSNEFGLGVLEIAFFLLTHQKWLSTQEDLGIDCIGCEYGPYGHGFYKYILFFYFNKYLKLEERWCGCPDKRFGSATGFIL